MRREKRSLGEKEVGKESSIILTEERKKTENRKKSIEKKEMTIAEAKRKDFKRDISFTKISKRKRGVKSSEGIYTNIENFLYEIKLFDIEK